MTRNRGTHLGLAVWVMLAGAGCMGSVSARGEEFIVKDGQAQAEIVIADQPAHMAKLAADELQTYIEKITGARLPITNAPGRAVPVQIYVGRSTHTDQLKISDEGLKSGAFKMVSGKNWLALVGYDRDFVVKGPLHDGGAMTTNSPALIEWDRLTGTRWGFPMGMMSWERNADLKIWEQDERGSFNAVTEFLRLQGVRWYLPGELGEIVPRKPTIALPHVDKTVRPDFRLRHLYQYGHMFARTTRAEVMWQLRLGLYVGPDPVLGGAHGLRNVQGRAEMKKAHPEYYGLYDGKRDTKGGHPCLSSEGLFQETVAYARAMFDIYDAKIVSVMPEDGYVSICQCDLCKGKDSPERDWTGQLSNHVWDFVNRVAQEVYKTHPDRKVTCAAYGAYLLPPENIAQLSPNVVVTICQWRSDFQDPKMRAMFVNLREGWLKKLPPGSQLGICDYYLHGRPDNNGLPVVFPHLIATDLKSLKGISVGEFIETYRDAGEDLRSLALFHLNFYVTSRFWWDADQDVNALLEDYYTNFYGPARDEMKAYIEYCEANWAGMRKSVEKIDQAFALLEKARQKVAADSVYGKRVALIVDFMQPMKVLREKVAIGRKNAPKAVGGIRDPKELRLDGKLDDKFWEGLTAYDLKDLKTGQPPVFPGSFKVAWASDSLYFGITCKEADMKSLKIGTARNEDPNMWNGDCVEILLESQNHAYYQLAINPAGAMIDLDRIRGTESIWASGARIAAFKGDDYWSLEVRVPVAGEQQEAIDPVHGLAGKQPTVDAPWFFNVCRQRMRETGNEASAFSPTGAAQFHNAMKFGELTVK